MKATVPKTVARNTRLSWWKWSALLLMAYTVVMGLLMPLKPGITQVQPSTITTGQSARINITGYNTRFDPQNTRVWLKLDSVHSIAARAVQIVSAQELYADFDVPAAMPYKQESYQTTVIVDGPQSGTALMPNAVYIRPHSDSITAQAWLKAAVSDLHPTPYLTIPYRNILAETIRNTYFHVPFWFAMIVLFGFSVYHAYKFLSAGRHESDLAAEAFAFVGTVFGILGLITGAVWAKNTWGAYWSFDVKQNMSLIAILIYCAYFVLRGSFSDFHQRARISAVYNIFAFATLIPLLFIIPRMRDSLHPGNGGNPAFGSQDLDNTMRMVFYPAVVAMILLGVWMAQLWYRYYRLKFYLENKD